MLIMWRWWSSYWGWLEAAKIPFSISTHSKQVCYLFTKPLHQQKRLMLLSVSVAGRFSMTCLSSADEQSSSKQDWHFLRNICRLEKQAKSYIYALLNCEAYRLTSWSLSACTDNALYLAAWWNVVLAKRSWEAQHYTQGGGWYLFSWHMWYSRCVGPVDK